MSHHERARITAWLRRQADDAYLDGRIVVANNLGRVADQIDRGQHLVPPVSNPDLWKECVRGS